MNLSEIAYKIVNDVIHCDKGQTITVSAELYNVFDNNETMVAIPFLEELAIAIRKVNCLPMIDISTERMHKRYFEEISDDNQELSTALLFKWLENSDAFIDLSWRSNPTFYKSIPDRVFKRMKIEPQDFMKIFEEKKKKMILLGYPTKGLADYYKIDHEILSQTYFSALNIDYFLLKKRCLIFANKMEVAEAWTIATENRLLHLELSSKAKCEYGDFNNTPMIVLPTGTWQQEISLANLNGIIYFDNLYFEHYTWQNIQIVFDDAKITDVETDVEQKGLNLLKTVLYSDIESIILNIGLNEGIKRKSMYSLFDMTKNRNLSLIINTEKGQMVAIAEKAALFTSSEENVLYEV